MKLATNKIVTYFSHPKIKTAAVESSARTDFEAGWGCLANFEKRKTKTCNCVCDCKPKNWDFPCSPGNASVQWYLLGIFYLLPNYIEWRNKKERRSECLLLTLDALAFIDVHGKVGPENVTHRHFLVAWMMTCHEDPKFFHRHTFVSSDCGSDYDNHTQKWSIL